MTQNEMVLDEGLSSGNYVTYREIADAVDKSNIEEQDRIVNAFKTIVRRYLKNALDYKNGKNARNGVKYKSDYEHYLKFLDEKNTLESKSGNDKRSYATVGLGLLLDDGSTEVTKIEFECVRNLTNAKMVKEIASHILCKRVLCITFLTKKNETIDVVFHPQYLKEYNNRWAVYGKSEGSDFYPTCIRIDSIKSLSIVPGKKGIKYKSAERNFYREYFKGFIGFTRTLNCNVQDVYIRTNNKTVHNLIKTKPFHESQVELQEWSEEEQYGKFHLQIIPNIELKTKLLSYGAGITLEGNGWFQKDYKEEVMKMAGLYPESPS